MGINLWLRGPLVLAEAFTPRWVTRQAAANPQQGWRYALHVHLAHPQIGAEWAAEAGCNDEVCWLIAHHQEQSMIDDTRRGRLLACLQWADEQN